MYIILHNLFYFILCNLRIYFFSLFCIVILLLGLLFHYSFMHDIGVRFYNKMRLYIFMMFNILCILCMYMQMIKSKKIEVP